MGNKTFFMRMALSGVVGIKAVKKRMHGEKKNINKHNPVLKKWFKTRRQVVVVRLV